MAVAFKTALGSSSPNVTSSSSWTITTTAAIAIGDLVVVRAAADNLSATTPTFTCADSGGNTYVTQRQAAANATAAAGVAGAIMCSKATVAVASGGTITITLSGAVVAKAAYAESFTGVDNTVRSTAVSATAASGTALASPASGTVNAGDLVIGASAIESRGAVTGDADTTNGSWSARELILASASGTDTARVEVSGQYKIPNASGAQTFNQTVTSTDWVAMLVVLQAALDPTITQASYRFYDQGTESGSTALGAQDTAINGDLTNGDGIGALRIRLQLTNAGTVLATDDWQLQYEKNSNGTWINVPGAGVTGYNDSNLTEGQATTNRLGAGSGTFVAGKVSEDGVVDDLAISANNYTELLFSCQFIKANFVQGDAIRFRVLYKGATTGMTYTQTPLVNVIRGASTEQATIATNWGSWTANATGTIPASVPATIASDWSGGASTGGGTPDIALIGTSNGTNITTSSSGSPTLPAGYTMTANDYIVIEYVSRGGHPAIPAGYTAVQSTFTGVGQGIFYRKLNGSENVPVISTAGMNGIICWVKIWRYANLSTFLDATSTQNTANATAPSITTVTAKAMVCNIGGTFATSDVWTFSAANGYTADTNSSIHASFNSNNGGQQVSSGSSHKLATTAGATTGPTFGVNTGNDCAILTYAIRPAASGTPAAVTAASFNGSTSQIKVSATADAGKAAFAGDTFMCLVNRSNSNVNNAVLAAETNSNSEIAEHLFEGTAAGSGAGSFFNPAGGTSHATTQTLSSSGWVLSGIDKVSGSNTPRHHTVRTAVGTWSHQAGSAALGDTGNLDAGAEWYIGSEVGAGEFFEGQIAFAAWWSARRLTDAEFNGCLDGSGNVSLTAILALSPTKVWFDLTTTQAAEVARTAITAGSASPLIDDRTNDGGGAGPKAGWTATATGTVATPAAGITRSAVSGVGVHNNTAPGTTITTTIDVATGDKIALIFVAIGLNGTNSPGDSAITVGNITLDGVTATQLAGAKKHSGADSELWGFTDIYYVKNPAVGTGKVLSWAPTSTGNNLLGEISCATYTYSGAVDAVLAGVNNGTAAASLSVSTTLASTDLLAGICANGSSVPSMTVGTSDISYDNSDFNAVCNMRVGRNSGTGSTALTFGTNSGDYSALSVAKLIPAAAPTALIQSVGGAGVADVNTITRTFSTNVTVGNKIIVGATVNHFFNTGDLGTGAVTDNLGNTYTRDVISSHPGFVTAIFSAPVTVGGACTVTINGVNSDDALGAVISEWSGLGAFDQSAFANGSSGTKATGNLAGTTAQANEVIIGVLQDLNTSQGAIAVQSGFTLIAQNTTATGGSNSTKTSIDMSYKILSATQNTGVSWPTASSVDWSAVAATYLASGGGGGPTTVNGTIATNWGSWTAAATGTVIYPAAVPTTFSNGTSASGSTVTLTKPAGSTAGDLLLLCYLVYDTDLIMSSMTGWTQILYEGEQAGTDDLFMTTYWADGAVSDLTVSMNGSSYVDWMIIRYVGANMTNPIDVAATGNSAATGTTATALGVTTTTPNTNLCIFTGGYNSTEVLSAGYSGFTQRIVNDLVNYAHTKDQLAAGATGNFTATKAVGGTWLTQIVAVRAAGATTTSPFTDDFNRTNGAMGSAWAALSGVVAPVIVSNGIEAPAANTDCAAIATGLWSTVQSVALDLVLGADYSEGGAILHGINAATGMLAIYTTDGTHPSFPGFGTINGPALQVYNGNGSTFTIRAERSLPAATGTHRIYGISLLTGQVQLWFDGVKMLSGSDGGNARTGSPGITIHHSSTVARGDNASVWSGTADPSAPTLSSFTPSSAPAGATIAVVGTNFVTDATMVTIGSVDVAVTVTSPTTGTFVIPQRGAASLSVTCTNPGGTSSGLTLVVTTGSTTEVATGAPAAHTSQTVAAPPGITGAADQKVFLYVMAAATSSSNPGITPPAGFSAVGSFRTDALLSGSGLWLHLQWFESTADHSAAANFTVTFASTLLSRIFAGTIRTSGFDVEAQASTSSLSRAIPSVTTTQANDIVIVTSINDPTGTLTTGPSGFTEASVSGTDQTFMHTFVGEQATAGATPTPTITLGGTSSAFSIATAAWKPYGAATNATATPAAAAVAVTMPSAQPRAGQTSSPAVITVLVTMPASTQTGGTGATTAPAVLSAIVSMPAAQARAGQTASPAVLSAIITMPAVTTTAGTGATRSPAVLTAAVAMPAVTAGGGTTTSPAVLNAVITMPFASTAGGTSATASPGVLNAIVTMPAVTLGAGQTTSPLFLNILVAMPAVQPRASSTLSPAVINAVVTMPSVAAGAGVVTSPGVVSVSVTMPAVAGSGGGTASPAALPAIITMPLVSTAGGTSATASPAVLSAAVTMPLVTIQFGRTIAPAVLPVLATMPQATPQAGSRTSPAVLNAAVTMPGVSTGGGAIGVPAVLAAVVSMPATTAQAGSTVSPAILAALVTLPAVTAGVSKTIAPAVLASVVTMPAVQPRAGQTATVAVLVAPITMPPTASAGASNATPTPAVIQTVVTMPAASPRSGSAVAIATCLVTITMPAPTLVAQSSRTVSLAPVNVVITLPSPSILAGGSATVNLGVILTQAIMQAVTVRRGATASPAPIAVSVNVLAVNLSHLSRLKRWNGTAWVKVTPKSYDPEFAQWVMDGRIKGYDPVAHRWVSVLREV